MKEDPLKRGGQHLRYVENQIALVGFHTLGASFEGKKITFYKPGLRFYSVEDYVNFKLKERIKGI